MYPSANYTTLASTTSIPAATYHSAGYFTPQSLALSAAPIITEWDSNRATQQNNRVQSNGVLNSDGHYGPVYYTTSTWTYK